MKDKLNLITDAFHVAGIDNKNVEFSITEYSLNSKLSFKFNNINELLLFLDVLPTSEKGKVVNAKFVESGIDPEKFFYVNFFKPKITEL